MKKNIYFFLLLLLLVSIPHKTKAFCDDSELVRLSKLAQNLKFSYVYNKNTNTFTINVTNLKQDLVIEYLNTEKKYNSNKELNFNNLYSGKHTFMVYAKSSTCQEEYLRTKYVELPYYNSFYGKDLCKGIEEYSFCTKWLRTKYNYDYQYNNILEYKNNLNKKEEKEKKVEYSTLDKIMIFIKENYVKYYYIILPTIISILCLIIYVKNKKSDLV